MWYVILSIERYCLHARLYSFREQLKCAWFVMLFNHMIWNNSCELRKRLNHPKFVPT